MRYLFYIVLLFTSGLLNAQIGAPNYLTNGANGDHVLVDLDNDGDLDIVAYRNAESSDVRQLIWFKNIDGQGLEWEPNLIDLPSTEVSIGFLGAADLTNDGWPDLIMGYGNVLVHDGDPNAVSFTPVIDGISGSNSMRFGDFNGDGALDVLRIDGGNTNGYFRIYLNESLDGNFPSSYSVGPIAPNLTSAFIYDAEIVDIDNDGDMDVAYTVQDETFNNFYYAWAENTDGQGDFEVHIIYEEYVNNFYTPIYLESDDYNGDGLADLVFSGYHGFDIYFQQADGSWVTGIVSPGTFGGDLVSADFDNDGDFDLMEGDKGASNEVYWMENIDGTGEFITHIFTDSIGTIAKKFYSAGDVDGDGDVDITFHNDGAPYDGIFYFENRLNENASFGTRQISDNINGSLDPFVIDLDNDGDNDVLFHAGPDKQIFWMENLDGLGSYSTPIELIVNELIEEIRLEDVDGDGDKDIIATNEGQELIWYENQSTNTVQFGPKQIITDAIFPDKFTVGDLDGDGDLDICIKKDGTTPGMYWYEQTAGNAFVSHFILDATFSMDPMAIGDVDNDGLADIVYHDVTWSQPQLWFFKQETGGSFSPELLLENYILKVEIVDLDDDQDNDLVLRIGDNYPGAYPGVLLYDGGGFNFFDFPNDEFLMDDFLVADLDGDGKKDIYCGEIWFRQLGTANNFSLALPLLDEGSDKVAIGDLDGDGKDDLICTREDDALVWVENQLGELSWVEGRVAVDEDFDCDLSQDSIGLYGWIVELQKGDTTYYASTNPEGYYTAFLPDSGSYIVNVNIVNNYWSSCFTDVLLPNVNPNATTTFDFPIQIEHNCPLMQIDMHVGNLRPCIEGIIIINYTNEGTVLAEDVEVEVYLDGFLELNSASLPYVDTDSSYLFEVGDVDFLQSGVIYLYVTPDCDSTEVGDVLCTDAYITPDSICLPLDSLWDGSEIEITGSCENDSVYFEITNVGDFGMEEARQFRAFIVNEDIVLMILVDTFMLESGEAKYIVLDAEMEAILMEADQDEDHPLLTVASTIVDDCIDFELPANLILLTGDPFSEEVCREVTGSYDPNEKEAIPLGYSSANLIDREWELDYTIHFQNTGNDTAFTVVVKDTLSDHLDLSTLRIGASTHSFTWMLNTERELSFTFNNILLPDSTTNEVLSHGHVQLFVTPNSDTPYGTQIGNQAGIYFDYNPPIITNEVIRTIRTPIIASSEHVHICEGAEFMGQPITADTMLIDSMLITAGLQIDYFHVHVEPHVVTAVDTMIIAGQMLHGVEVTQDTSLEVLLQTVYGCDSLILYEIATLVSTQDLNKEYGVIVYPTPSDDVCYVEWDNVLTAPSAISLLTTNGQLLMVETFGENTILNSPYKIDLNGLARGVYWLQIDLPEGRVFERIIKM